MTGVCGACGYRQKETTPPCAKCGSVDVRELAESAAAIIDRLLEAFGLYRGN